MKYIADFGSYSCTMLIVSSRCKSYKPRLKTKKRREWFTTSISTLTTDEDREREAEAREPGSYYVLANPHSFASLPEYRDESYRPLQLDGRDTESDWNTAVQDPDIVILRTFEESRWQTRRGSAPSLSRKDIFATSPKSYTEVRTIPQLSQYDDRQAVFSRYQEQCNSQIMLQVDDPQSPKHANNNQVRRGSQSMVQNYPENVRNRLVPLLEILKTESRDSELLDHYRKVLSPLLNGRSQLAGEGDIFESRAKTYPAVSFNSQYLSNL